MINSKVTELGIIEIPLINDKISMVPFELSDLKGMPDKFKHLVNNMLTGIKQHTGTAYFTIHGRKLVKKETLRRPGPHTDGNYEPIKMTFGGGWKVGENGPPIGSETHQRQYVSSNGGILLASNFEACNGYIGEFEGMPGVGGDCRNIKLNESFRLKRNTVYYGNNHFIHESLPMSEDVHRVFARITLPENHKYLEAINA